MAGAENELALIKPSEMSGTNVAVSFDLEMTSHSVQSLDAFTTEAPYQQIISDEMMRYLNFYLIVLLCGLMGLFGAVNNVVNMVIFHQLGLKDSMSVCLFGLALTDFLVSVVVVLTRMLHLWKLFFAPEVINPLELLNMGPSWVSDFLFLCSGWITSILSLERCVCVIFPFKVKQIFTKKRSVVFLISLYVAGAALLTPIFLSRRLAWTVEEDTANGTRLRRRLALIFSEKRDVFEFYVELLNMTVTQMPPLGIILGSVGWMVYGLHASSQTRHAMTAGGVDDGQRDGDKSAKMDSRTKRLVKVVLTLAIIFTTCSIPRMYATVSNFVNTDINLGGKEPNLSNFQWQITRFFAALNASVNIVVYLKINSSYRAKFNQLFSFACRSTPPT